MVIKEKGLKITSMWSPNFLEDKKVRIKVEFDPTPIRHLAIQCPSCKNWFVGCDIIKNDCVYEYQLTESECECPKCGDKFIIDCESDIENGDFPEFYDKCLKQIVTWE